MTPNPEQSERLLALAALVETATGPDRELDAEIALALGIVAERDGNVFFGHKDYSCMVLERSYYDIEGSAPELAAYTTSLDAAMTLLPEGHEWLRWGPGTMIVMLPPQPGDDEKVWARHIECRGANPAIALAAACLRARARAGDGA